MRKFTIAALAVTAVLTVASVADAQQPRQRVNFGQAVARGAGFALGQRLVGGLGGGGFHGGAFRQPFYGGGFHGSAFRQPFLGGGFYGGGAAFRSGFYGASQLHFQQAYCAPQQLVIQQPLIVPQQIVTAQQFVVPQPLLIQQEAQYIQTPQALAISSACGSLGLGAGYGYSALGLSGYGCAPQFRTQLRFRRY